MTVRIATSWLFVPGSQPDRFTKAVASGADQVVLDLEDAVAGIEKDDARRHVVDWLSREGSAWVRLNGWSTPWHEADIEAVAELPGLRGIMVPKAESPEEMARLATRLQSRACILALVETASGVARATMLAASITVCRLAFGSVDFLLDIDADESDEALACARSALVVAARAADIPGPIDGITLETRDTEVVMHDARLASQLGFAGKLCIHPAQVAALNSAFAPPPLLVEWAKRVVAHAPRDPDEALHEVAFDLDGRMIDKPALERARRVLARARRSQHLT